MSNFRTDSRTESFLQSFGVDFSHDESLSYDELANNWNLENNGRPEGQRRVERAVESYAQKMISGSRAPSVIVWQRADKSYDVLDGNQRLMANQKCGRSTFGAYVVRCKRKTAQKLRIVSNIEINGIAPVDSDWTLEQLVQTFLIDGSEKAADLEGMSWTRPQIDATESRLRTKHAIHCAFDSMGKEPPRLNKGVIDIVAKYSGAREDFRSYPKQACDILAVIHETKLTNSEAKEWLDKAFNPGRRKNRAAQLNTASRQMRQDATIAKRLAGKTVKTSDEKLLHAVKSLHTIIRENRKKKHQVTDEVLAKQLHRLTEESLIWLREQIDPKVAAKVSSLGAFRFS